MIHIYLNLRTTYQNQNDIGHLQIFFIDSQ
ncbi:hypothetical protein SAMN06265371_101463 [Lutibacter agarilyticus]|uniref:Uncharacterized protein n=1 Tax=Lutibacter agarilyticus TaxID=1109740 RepID=A0A238VHP8_9FLAO|nr:hypothetical protein SAMN06265371_101463 [Lutibacter agarilyticus]